MRSFLDATPMGRHSLEPPSGEVSRRTGALAARSTASHACIGHPVSKDAFVHDVNVVPRTHHPLEIARLPPWGVLARA